MSFHFMSNIYKLINPNLDLVYKYPGRDWYKNANIWSENVESGHQITKAFNVLTSDSCLENLQSKLD